MWHAHIKNPEKMTNHLNNLSYGKYKIVTQPLINNHMKPFCQQNHSFFGFLSGLPSRTYPTEAVACLESKTACVCRLPALVVLYIETTLSILIQYIVLNVVTKFTISMCEVSQYIIGICTN